MKIALYIEDGLEQLVLTPDSEHEKALLGKLGDPSRNLEIRRGTFYACAGGWMRQGRNSQDESTIIVLRKVELAISSDQSRGPLGID